MKVRAAALPIAVALLAGAAPSGAGQPVWVPTQPVQTGAQDRLAALPDGTVWAVVDHDRVLRSTDAGQTWLPVNPVPVQAAGIPLSGPRLGGSSDTQVAPESAQVALAANGGVLSKTTDGGTTWVPVPSPHVTNSTFFEWSDQLERTPAGYWLAKGGMEVKDLCPMPLRTTPLMVSADARSWRRSDIPRAGGSVLEVRFADARHGVATVIEYDYEAPVRDGNSCSISGSADSSGVYVTADGGRHWRRALGCRPVCYGVSWSSIGRLVLGRADGRVLVSKDLGRTFRQLASVPTSSGAVGFLQALDCVGTRCWASVNGAGVFRHDGSGEWVMELSHQSSPGLAIGDLAAIDRERAVTGGPTALATRLLTPVPSVRAKPVPAPSGSVTVGPGTTVDATGAWHRRIVLTG